jgi:hypothetical protein
VCGYGPVSNPSAKFSVLLLRDPCLPFRGDPATQVLQTQLQRRCRSIAVLRAVRRCKSLPRVFNCRASTRANLSLILFFTSRCRSGSCQCRRCHYLRRAVSNWDWGSWIDREQCIMSTVPRWSYLLHLTHICNSRSPHNRKLPSGLLQRLNHWRLRGVPPR